MSLALAAVVVAALNPSTPVAETALAQKVEVIKGSKKAKKSNVVVEDYVPPQQLQDNSQNNANVQRAAELDKKAAALDAKEKDLATKEQAIDEKQTADKEKADKLKQQQKVIEKIGQQNQKMVQQAADALAGGE